MSRIQPHISSVSIRYDNGQIIQYNTTNNINIFITPKKSVSYGPFLFPQPCPFFTNDGGKDCPQAGLNYSINGPQIGASLLQAKERLKSKISEKGIPFSMNWMKCSQAQLMQIK